MPLSLDAAAMERIALGAIAAMPDLFRRHLEGIAVHVEEFADRETLGELEIDSPWDLLGVYQGLIGVKTGTTPEAGECLVFAAKRNGHTLIGVVLHSTTDASRFTDAKMLLNWGFSLRAEV